MRLRCPTCAAEYEIEDAAIPEAGRDVQCSACGHGWHHRPQPRLVLDAPPAAAPTDFRAFLREEAEREAAQRRAEGSSAIAPPAAERPKKGGFVAGMFLALLPLAVLAGIYAGAAQIKAQAPGLAEPIQRYADAVDQGRRWLHDTLDR
ncbi:zinc-ribbon domain-containing protein [Falsirhodobacter algicola]|uniref:Zinc finger/thioredoxin putative domain-containing protein n=1 Tax=Falsirhodobacter algicola TaxID=2692330 RepID=A0A8J8MT27_9RHOB|nr:zinc-ribbon domain-containing protein [Falsirhodobacter algicola]QUS35901.1 hypothetical protein GR316_06280 [Falsirhodobacter algicola]